MSVEWNTETEREFQQYVAEWKQNMQFAEFDPETVVMNNFRRREDKFWRIFGGLLLFGACIGFWYLFFTHV